MKKQFVIAVAVLSILVVLPNHDLLFAQEDTEILIASWNMLLYSEDRALDDENRKDVAEILLGRNYDGQNEPGRDYDIIFVQEILSNGTSLDILCEDLEAYYYECKTTPEIRGDGTRPETYGVIYKDYLDVEIQDTRNDDVTPTIKQGQDYRNNEMVRPPMKAIVTVGDKFQFTVYNNHIKPSDSTNKKMTEDELRVLQRAINYVPDSNSAENIVVLGDLNAGGTYLKKGLDGYPDLFKPEGGWYSLFTNSDHTTFAKEKRPYDRIIVNDNMYQYHTGERGIIKNLTNGDSFGYPNPGYYAGDYRISDHGLIFAEFRIPISELAIDKFETNNSDYLYGMLAVILAAIGYEKYGSRIH